MSTPHNNVVVQETFLYVDHYGFDLYPSGRGSIDVYLLCMYIWTLSYKSPFLYFYSSMIPPTHMTLPDEKPWYVHTFLLIVRPCTSIFM